MSYLDLKDRWSAFYSLFKNELGIRLKLNIPDTVVFTHGKPAAWYFTSKEGYVQCQPASKLSVHTIQKHFLRYAVTDCSYACQYVAIVRHKDGLPKLLNKEGFMSFCNIVESSLNDGEPSINTDVPQILQAYIPPFLDLRYITSITNDGLDLSSQTFQRRFSCRYLANKPPVMKITDNKLKDMSQWPSAIAAAGDGINGAVAAAAASEVHDNDKANADMERCLDKVLGPVDPGLKMVLRKTVHGLVQYVQKAQGLTLRGLVCEFIRDSAGEVYFLGTIRTDWASLIPGRGGEPWANANLTQQINEEESIESRAACTWEEPNGGKQDTDGDIGKKPQSHAALLASGTQAAPDVRLKAMPDCNVEPCAAIAAKHGLHCKLQVLSKTAPLSCSDAPNLVAIQEDSIHSSPVAFADILEESPSSFGNKQTAPGINSPGPMQHCSLRTLPAAGKIAGSRSPGAASIYGERHHLNEGRKCATQLTSQLTKEIVSLQDDLIMKAELASALAAKVEALEHDKHIITDAFERVTSELQADLQDVKNRLYTLHRERDKLVQQLQETQQRLSNVQHERDEYMQKLDGERGTTMISLGEFQRRHDEAVSKAAQAEQDLVSLQEKFREEQVAYDALKKQMVFYQHTLSAAGLRRNIDSSKDTIPTCRDRERSETAGTPALALLRGQNSPEIKFWETLSAVEDLLHKEADPDGERYALAKVLHTCQADLHAIFLHYCILDCGFARHWPPQLTLAGWTTFVKDVMLTNIVPGTRTRTDSTIPVSEAQEMFRRHCSRQAIMSGNASLLNLPSMKFKGNDERNDVNRPSSAASVLATGRPNNASSIACLLSFEGFCALLVYLGARRARTSPDTLLDNPFLSEQARAFIEDIAPRAQRLTPIAGQNKRTPGPGSAPGTARHNKLTGAATPKLPKLRKSRSKVHRAAGGFNMRPISEASGEGSAVSSPAP